MNNVSISQQDVDKSTSMVRSLGKAVLTEPEKAQLDMLGTVFSNFSVDSGPPKAYEIVSLTLHYKGKPERKGYRHLLPHVEEMAANGLNVDQIARRLGMPENLLADAMWYYPEIYHAIMGGKARGVDEAAATISRNARAGDTAAAKFKLQTKGEFQTAKQQGPAPAVQINLGAAEAPVRSDTMDVLKDRQKTIIESVDFSELN